MSLTRRHFVAASASLLGVAAAGHSLAAVPWSSGEKSPRLKFPSGSVDCHMHLFDDRVPPVPNAKLRPPNASLADYRQLQERLGVHRMVIVTPSTYGFNNQVLMDGLLASNGNARGVAVIEPTISDDDLQKMHAAGVRGVRINLSFGGAGIEYLEPLAARVNELGWHVQFVSPGNALPSLEARLRKLPGNLVIDHLGEVEQPGGLHSEPFKVLQRLLDTDKTWIKLSGAYISSAVGAPSYGDYGQLAKRLVSQRPDRFVWGSDWPHVTEKGAKPDDALLADLLLEWIPSESVRNQILLLNPSKLYEFTA